MKRFAVISVLVVVIVGVMLYFMPRSADKKIISVIPDDARVNVYCRETDLECVDLGYGRIVTCRPCDLSRIVSSCRQIDGISAGFCGTVEDFLQLQRTLGLKDVTCQQFDEMSVVCGRCDSVVGGAVVDGKEVNCQIAYSKGVITVGFPLILGEY